MIRDNIPSAIRGAAALQEALDVIGTSAEDGGDKKMAQVIVDNEMPLRDMLRQFLTGIAEEL
jgi:hypothetical protein